MGDVDYISSTDLYSVHAVWKENSSLHNNAELFKDFGNESEDRLFHLESVQPARLPVAEVQWDHLRT